MMKSFNIDMASTLHLQQDLLFMNLRQKSNPLWSSYFGGVVKIPTLLPDRKATFS